MSSQGDRAILQNIQNQSVNFVSSKPEDVSDAEEATEYNENKENSNQNVSEATRILYSEGGEPEKKALHPPITLTPTSTTSNEEFTPPSVSPASQSFLRAYNLDLRRCSTPAGNPKPVCMLECRYCRFLSEGVIFSSSASPRPPQLLSPSGKSPSPSPRTSSPSKYYML